MSLENLHMMQWCFVNDEITEMIYWKMKFKNMQKGILKLISRIISLMCLFIPFLVSDYSQEVHLDSYRSFHWLLPRWRLPKVPLLSRDFRRAQDLVEERVLYGGDLHWRRRTGKHVTEIPNIFALEYLAYKHNTHSSIDGKYGTFQSALYCSNDRAPTDRC